MMEKTLVIITGGTIEALYDIAKGTPYHVPVPDSPKDSVIPAAIEKMGLSDQVDIYPLSMLDSKEITTYHLDHILDKMMNEGYQRVIIVHGTDTMAIHAQYIKRRLAEYGKESDADRKTIVFTGAMGPMRDEAGQLRDPHTQPFLNDGWENLQKAMKDVSHEAPGVYIEMGEGPWEADTIRKHVQLDDNPNVRLAQVKHSGFIEDDPKRHQQIIF